MNHYDSSLGMPSQLGTHDLSSLGTRAALAMTQADTSYRAFLAACALLFDELSDELVQVRLYMDDNEPSTRTRILREEANADQYGGQEGSDHIPYYQLPESLTKHMQPLHQNLGDQWEILIPLARRAQEGASNLLVGMLAMVASHPFPGYLTERLQRLASSLSLGVQYVQRARESERANFLLDAVTTMSQAVQGTEGVDRLLENFVNHAVHKLGFDRATFFLYGNDDTTVRKAICARVGQQVRYLEHFPELPKIDRAEPHQHLPGLWIPIRMSKPLGMMFVDNIYSLESPPRDAIKSLVDLSAQVALALENQNLLQKLRHAALRDDLTGLYRPGYFAERVQEELANSRRRKDSTGLLLLDLDHFKTINDTWGHPVGDEVLMLVADRIRSASRVGDTPCRKGGDEFLILVPGLTPERVETIAMRLIDEIHKNPIVLPSGQKLEIGVSIGAALFPTHADNWEELWSRADEALYKAKQAGRGKWRLWTGEPAPVLPPVAPKTRGRKKASESRDTPR